MVKWIKTPLSKWVPGFKSCLRTTFTFCLFICYHKSGWDRVVKMEDNTSFKAKWQWRIILHLRKRSCCSLLGRGPGSRQTKPCSQGLSSHISLDQESVGASLEISISVLFVGVNPWMTWKMQAFIILLLAGFAVVCQSGNIASYLLLHFSSICFSRLLTVSGQLWPSLWIDLLQFFSFIFTQVQFRETKEVCEIITSDICL